MANLRVVGQTDNFYTIAYDGLVLGVYEVVAYRKEMLTFQQPPFSMHPPPQ